MMTKADLSIPSGCIRSRVCIKVVYHFSHQSINGIFKNRDTFIARGPKEAELVISCNISFQACWRLNMNRRPPSVKLASHILKYPSKPHLSKVNYSR